MEEQIVYEGEYTTKYAGTKLNVYNWGEYISDGSDESYDTNSEFEIYAENYYREKLGKDVVFAADDTVVGENAKAAVAAMKDGDVVEFRFNVSK